MFFAFSPLSSFISSYTHTSLRISVFIFFHSGHALSPLSFHKTGLPHDPHPRLYAGTGYFQRASATPSPGRCDPPHRLPGVLHCSGWSDPSSPGSQPEYCVPDSGSYHAAPFHICIKIYRSFHKFPHVFLIS